ncbi:MAG: hypothetical protein ACRDN0_34860 [Trebonia sp.]
MLDGDSQLRHVARLIRDFHDAVAGFTPPPAARRPAPDGRHCSPPKATRSSPTTTWPPGT